MAKFLWFIAAQVSKESSILLTHPLINTGLILVLLAAIPPNVLFWRNTWWSPQLIPSNVFSSSNYSTNLSSNVKTFKEFLLLNEFQYCWQQQWRHLGDHIPLPSPCFLISLVNQISLISTAALSQRRVQPFTSQLSSFASDPFLKKWLSSFKKLYLEGRCGPCTKQLSSTIVD